MIFQDHIKQVLDVASIGTVVATLTEWLPPIAAGVSIIWGLLRAYEIWLNIQKIKKQSKKRI